MTVVEGRQSMEEFLLTTEAARVLGKSAETVRLYERVGRLYAIRTSSGVRLFRKADVLRLAETMAADKALPTQSDAGA